MKNGKEAWFVEDENVIFFDGKDKNIISNIKKDLSLLIMVIQKLI